MSELQRIAKEITEKFGLDFSFYAENTNPKSGPVCDRQFESVIDDGNYTFFRFLYKGTGYVGSILGVGETELNYARLLPPYIESFVEKEAELSKTEHLKRILQGESSSMGIYKYTTKYSVKGAHCFTILLRVPKLMEETLAVLEQYGGNSLDTAVQMSEQTCVLVRFLGTETDGYRASVDYAEFLAQSLKEELGLDVDVGVGPIVRELKDVAFSYTQAENTLRYADVFAFPGSVHTYRECILIKMIEDIPEVKLAEYFSQITDEHFKEVFDDEEMLETAENFLRSSLNVSETSRNLYMHRNTLLYRLDKIEKSTGLNIRLFSDAVSFRVLTVLHRLLKK
ncbi:MAG: helix-turn-helix domain-containing protein [Clostridia bacterium]|nr:helix-turn-helix domain-containing protein [Clostridia bacterium]